MVPSIFCAPTSKGISRSDWPDTEAQFLNEGRVYGIDFLDAWNSFESSLWGTVHISLINAEVTMTVTSLLRCLCPSLAWNTLSRSDSSCHC